MSGWATSFGYCAADRFPYSDNEDEVNEVPLEQVRLLLLSPFLHCNLALTMPTIRISRHWQHIQMTTNQWPSLRHHCEPKRAAQESKLAIDVPC